MTDVERFATELNLEAERGAYWEIEATLKDDANVAINFTGCTGRMYIKRNLRDTTALKQFTTTNGRMTLNNAGLIHVDNNTDFFADLSAGTYYYDLFVTDAGGKPIKYFTGTFIINGSVSVPA